MQRAGVQAGRLGPHMVFESDDAHPARHQGAHGTFQCGCIKAFCVDLQQGLGEWQGPRELEGRAEQDTAALGDGEEKATCRQAGRQAGRHSHPPPH